MGVIAFVPVRGGSKSIPLKNIKILNGKPLVFWSLLALEEAKFVDQIIVATDSSEIENVVSEFNFNKVKIYRRLLENATDTASTESVMLEYINASSCNPSDIFLLVQATSPLIQSTHIDEALSIFQTHQFDSMLSCTRNYRFFWNSDGSPVNYDIKNRPRRQDFDGVLMENGAFYINHVKSILLHKNRLSGRIGIYEMPEYTATEIDEPDDWVIMENLVKKYHPNELDFSEIKILLTDVDGVLTDGGMYYSETGDELKKFNTKDGLALRLIQNKGVKTGIITSENTKIVERRANKLNIDYLYQGKMDGGKLSAAIDICRKEGVTLENVAYIGDDINCFELLSVVGLAACPADACSKIKDIPKIIQLSKKGGEGVVREFVDLIMKNG